ncbi:MAG: acetate kinase [Mobiluncus porci]|uniref:acetate/propionate family kinase n=1 Tax=Mobiluncus TaxID=2050 RepID=UPI0023F010AB|nr:MULTISPECIES: acetate kinase [Mobiluncus]MCI6583835.1 acetate kinase [Mobiluncus sp.]MDD7541635.1 acetate kinase [Mobiluncus porci]MDY5749024.1 acetate kinase [Mobiluncus porci]
MNQQTIFVINSGSSSLKYQLIEPVSGDVLAKGLAERIGTDRGEVTHIVHGEKHTDTLPLPTHKEALNHIIDLFKENGPDLDHVGLAGFGHRIVQGGWYFKGAAIVNDDVHAKITELCDLAPLHNPAHLIGIDTAMELWPNLPHIAVFDTAFFADLPEKTRTYALDKETAHKYRIRRYGAHGTSHEFVSGTVCDYLGKDTVRQITLHLGNGASACAELGRKAIDTSMGLTPLEGLVMGTRTGDIDPAVVFHLLRKGMNVEEIDTLFNKKSGMLGLCGDNDMRDVWQRRDDGDSDALLALQVYQNRLLKYIGAYTFELGGLDVLTFTAGIGENDARTRYRLCEKLEFIGVKIDKELNENRDPSKSVWRISTEDSKVLVLVVPTNEELAIARQAIRLI